VVVYEGTALMRDPYVCGGCERRFRSLEAFDAHRTTPGTPGPECVDPATLRTSSGRVPWTCNAFGEWHRYKEASTDWQTLRDEGTIL